MNRANASVTVVYTYTSSTAAVATVSAAGMVTAVAPGTTTITVTAAGTGTGFAAATMTSAATITVSDRAPGLTSLQVSPASAALTVGGTQSVTASAQGPRAAAATITYGTSAPAIATVSATGVITAVAAGTATITVTAQSTQDGAFAASSITGLVTVTVSNPAVVSINISALTQGPTTTSYDPGTSVASSGRAGIVSGTNGQMGQAIDINNTRDQIQMTATLATNGARVDSVVAYVANADGTSRTSVGGQSYPSGAASGNVSLYINTADFTADFTAGTAAVKFANGQKRISVSAFSGATELQSTNSQTVNFTNVDGYASQLAAPARSVTTAAGVIWHGGGDSTTADMGRAVIVPVFYTPARVPASLLLGMRQATSSAVNAVCAAAKTRSSAPYAVQFGFLRLASGTTTVIPASSDTTVLGCAMESADAHVIGVTGGTDNSGTALPIVNYAGGFRTSATVTAPTALKLDYLAPTATAINVTRVLPAVTGWLNADYNLNTATAPTSDAGAGMPGTAGSTEAALLSQTANRAWSRTGCGATTYTVLTTGLASEIGECPTIFTNAAWTIRYTDADVLGNKSVAVIATAGVDVTAPTISFGGTAVDSIGTAAATITPSFTDALSGFHVGPLGAGVADAEGPLTGFVVRAAGALNVSPTTAGGAQCYRLTAAVTAASTTPSSAGTNFMTVPSCAPVSASIQNLSSLAGPAIAAKENQITLVSVTITDRAGNSNSGTHRYFADASQASAAAATAPTEIGTTNPTIAASITDNVKVMGASVVLAYGVDFDADGGTTDVLRLPYQSLSTPFATPLNANATPSLTIATPAPMATSINAHSATTTAWTKLASVNVIGYDRVGSATGTAASVSAAAIATRTAPTANVDFSVLTSLDAAHGAAAGLKAMFITTTTSTTNLFRRVDFYRLVAANAYEYVGSGTTAVASPVVGSAAVRYTYAIESYANTPAAAVAQAAASQGQKFLAIAVASTGEARWAAGQIGGNAVRVTITGLPAGGAGSVTISNAATAYSQVITANGTYSLPATMVTYTVTVNNVTVNNSTYVGTSSPGSFSTAGENAVAVTYLLNTPPALQATISGLPSGVTGGFTHGSTAVTTLANGVNTTAVVAGTYTITSPSVSPSNVSRLAAAAAVRQATARYILTGALSGLSSGTSGDAVVAAGAPGAFGITYTNALQRVELVTTSAMTVGSSVTLTGFTLGCSGGTALTVITTQPEGKPGTGESNFYEVGATATERTLCTFAITAGAFNAVNKTHAVKDSKVYDVALTTATATPTAITGATPATAQAAMAITVAAPAIRISTAGLTAGLTFSVQVTSAAYAGGTASFTCTAGSICDIPIDATNTYAVSVNRRVDVGAQRWFVSTLCASSAVVVTSEATRIAFNVGTMSISGACGSASAADGDVAGNVQISGLSQTVTATSVADHLKLINLTFVGPTVLP